MNCFTIAPYTKEILLIVVKKPKAVIMTATLRNILAIMTTVITTVLMIRLFPKHTATVQLAYS